MEMYTPSKLIKNRSKKMRFANKIRCIQLVSQLDVLVGMVCFNCIVELTIVGRKKKVRFNKSITNVCTLEIHPKEKHMCTSNKQQHR